MIKKYQNTPGPLPKLGTPEAQAYLERIKREYKQGLNSIPSETVQNNPSVRIREQARKDYEAEAPGREIQRKRKVVKQKLRHNKTFPHAPMKLSQEEQKIALLDPALQERQYPAPPTIQEYTDEMKRHNDYMNLMYNNQHLWNSLNLGTPHGNVTRQSLGMDLGIARGNAAAVDAGFMSAAAGAVAPSLVPGSAFWSNPLTKQLFASALGYAAVDEGSKQLTGKTVGENVGQAIEELTGWNPRSRSNGWLGQAAGKILTDGLNPGAYLPYSTFNNAATYLNTIGRTFGKTSKGYRGNFLMDLMFYPSRMYRAINNGEYINNLGAFKRNYKRIMGDIYEGTQFSDKFHENIFEESLQGLPTNVSITTYKRVPNKGNFAAWYNLDEGRMYFYPTINSTSNIARSPLQVKGYAAHERTHNILDYANNRWHWFLDPLGIPTRRYFKYNPANPVASKYRKVFRWGNRHGKYPEESWANYVESQAKGWDFEKYRLDNFNREGVWIPKGFIKDYTDYLAF